MRGHIGPRPAIDNRKDKRPARCFIAAKMAQEREREREREGGEDAERKVGSAYAVSLGGRIDVCLRGARLFFD